MATGDLTTLGAVKERAEVATSNDDTEIQDAVSAFSAHLVSHIGIGASLYSVAEFQEVRDGNGNNRMFTRYRPIANVSAVQVNGVSITPAGAWPSFGFYINDDMKSISIRIGLTRMQAAFGAGAYSLFRSPLAQSRGFDAGQGNVFLDYFAGNNGPPPDLEYAVRCVVALNYKRKGWQDQASRSTSIQGGSATTRYRDWKWPDEYESVFEEYRRKAYII